MSSLARPLAFWPSRYLRCIRYRELFFLQGSPLLGVAFALGTMRPDAMGRVSLFALAGFLLLAHTFTFNDWADFVQDQRHPEKACLFASRDASRRELGILSFALLSVALVLFALLSHLTLVLAVLLASLGLLYSHPVTNVRGLPVASTALHLVAGIVHFLLGYSLYGRMDQRGLWIGLFFGMTFAAGHLNQEVRDHEGDRRNGIRTNAVAFGTTATFAAGQLLFALAYAHLVALALTGLVPPVLRWVGLLYLVHIGWALRTRRAGLTFDSMSRFQEAYRAFYGLIGAAMLAALLAG